MLRSQGLLPLIKREGKESVFFFFKPGGHIPRLSNNLVHRMPRPWGGGGGGDGGGGGNDGCGGGAGGCGDDGSDGSGGGDGA